MKPGLSVKDMAKEACYYSGAAKLLFSAAKYSALPRLFIFNYHRVCHVSNNRNHYLELTQAVSEQHLRFIKNNFVTVSLTKGMQEINKETARGVYATITIDDGYLDNYTYAYPLLKKYNIPATIFLTTDFINGKQMFWWDKVLNIVSSMEPNELEIYIDSEKYHFNLNGQVNRRDIAKYINTILMAKDEKVIKATVKWLEDEYKAAEKAGGYPILGWKEIREMKEGGISFGSHTKTHRNLCLLRDDEILAELKDSKKAIEDALDMEISEFAYPFGIFDERVKRLVRQAGFSCARTILQAYNTKDTDMYYLNAVPADLLLSASSFAARCLRINYT